jgi:hypothetical protein
MAFRVRADQLPYTTAIETKKISSSASTRTSVQGAGICRGRLFRASARLTHKAELGL